MKVKYEQLFPTASFLNCRIGFELDIEDDMNVSDALLGLKDMAQAFHMKEFPQLYKQNKPIYNGEEMPKEIQVSKPSPESNMITAITTCTTPDVLKTFEKLSKSNPKFQEAYDNRMEFLLNASYDILDKNGMELPSHYSGRDRTYVEAKKMLDSFNQNGEYKPYTLKLINQ